jgi:hypothetical protein
MGDGGTTLRIFNRGFGCGSVVRLSFQPLYLPEKEPPVPFGWRMGGTHTRSACPAPFVQQAGMVDPGT